MVQVNAMNNSKAIIFLLNNKEYSISVDQVISIEKILPITRVPNLPSFVIGVINLRGIIVPIIDLKRRFDLGEVIYTKNTRIIIVSYNGIEAGLIVDFANDVLDFNENEIEPRPDAVGTVKAEFISGVIKHGRRLLIHLNLENVLDNTSIRNVKYGY